MNNYNSQHQQNFDKSNNRNIPIYERRFVSTQTISKFPQYRELFAKCPNCGKNSLKPIGFKFMTPQYIISNKDKLERRCGVCEFTQKPLGSF